jgi:hypothetical protein
MNEKQRNVLHPLVIPASVRKDPGRATEHEPMVCRKLLVPEWMLNQKEIDLHVLKREALVASQDLYEGRELLQGKLVIRAIDRSLGQLVLAPPPADEPDGARKSPGARALSGVRSDLILTGHGFAPSPETRAALTYLMATDDSARQNSERDRLIPMVLAAVSRSLGDINKKLVTFTEVVRIFSDECKASPRSTELRLNVFQMGKLDLLRAIRTSTEAVDVLTSRPIFPNLKPLAEKAKFVARYLIISLAESPSYRRLLTLGRAKSKSEVELTREILLGLSHARSRAERSQNPDLVSVFFAQEDALRKMSAVLFARVALLFLKEQEAHFSSGKGLDAFTSVLRHAYRENSNLSLAVLNAAFSLNSWFMSTLYGEPRTTCAIILGGANARREFPSFDFDVIGIYRDQGDTKGGRCGCLSHVYFYNTLMDLIKMTLQSMDKNFDTKFQNICGLKSEMIDSDDDDLENISVGTLDEYERHFWKNTARLHEDRISMMTLAHGAGDDSLTQDFMIMVDKAVLQPTADDLRAPADEVMRWYVKRNYSKSENNIKHSRGGLRDIHRIVWLSGKRDNPRDIPYALKEVFRGNPKAYDRIMISYNFLMNLRIRIDLYYGRNDKYLPTGKDRETFARSLGCSSGEELVNRCQEHMHAVTEVADAYFEQVLAENDALKDIVDREIKKQEQRLQRQRQSQERAAEKVHQKRVGTAASMIGGRSANSFLRQLWAERYVNRR